MVRLLRIEVVLSIHGHPCARENRESKECRFSRVLCACSQITRLNPPTPSPPPNVRCEAEASHTTTPTSPTRGGSSRPYGYNPGPSRRPPHHALQFPAPRPPPPAPVPPPDLSGWDLAQSGWAAPRRFDLAAPSRSSAAQEKPAFQIFRLEDVDTDVSCLACCALSLVHKY